MRSCDECQRHKHSLVSLDRKTELSSDINKIIDRFESSKIPHVLVAKFGDYNCQPYPGTSGHEELKFLGETCVNCLDVNKTGNVRCNCVKNFNVKKHVLAYTVTY